MLILLISVMMILNESKCFGEFVRGCYFTNWSTNRNGEGRFLPENYVPGLCTHMIYAFAGMNTDFTIKPMDINDEDKGGKKGLYARVIDLKKLQPNLKVLLSFGGYTFSQENAPLLQFMVSSQQTRQKFIDSVVKMLLKYGFDGFDVAWLFPANKDQFTVFLRELKIAFNEKEILLLSASVSGVPSIIKTKYDARSISTILDAINVISYAFHGPWEQVVGHNSPLFDRNGDGLSISSAVETWYNAGIAKNKIIVGLASYGQGWTLASNNSEVGAPSVDPSPPNPFTKEPGIAAYYELCALSSGSARNYDIVQENPFIIINQRWWYSYDNIKSFQAKLRWIKDNGYGGANVWTLDHDDFNGNCQKGETPKFPLISLLKELDRSVVAVDQKTDLTDKSPIFVTDKESTTVAINSSTVTNDTTSFDECTEAGFREDPEICGIFHFCDEIGVKSRKVNCLLGPHFDDVRKICEPASKVNCTL